MPFENLWNNNDVRNIESRNIFFTGGSALQLLKDILNKPHIFKKSKQNQTQNQYRQEWNKRPLKRKSTK